MNSPKKIGDGKGVGIVLAIILMLLASTLTLPSAASANPEYDVLWMAYEPHQTKSATGIAWGQNNDIFITYGYPDRGLERRDAITGNESVSIDAGSGSYYALEISPNGQYVALASDKTWNSQSNFSAGRGAIEVRWSQNLTLVWEYNDEPGYFSPQSQGIINQLKWSPDGNWLCWISMGGEAVLFDISAMNAEYLTLAANPLHYIDWSPDGKHLAFSNSSSLIVYDVQSGVVVNELMNWGNTNENRITAISWSKEGEIAVGDSVGKLLIMDGNLSILYDSQTTLNYYNGTAFENNNPILHLAWSHDLSRLAVATISIAVVIFETTNWNIYSNITLGELLGFDKYLAWSPLDNNHLAVGTNRFAGVILERTKNNNLPIYLMIGTVGVTFGVISIKYKKRGENNEK